jgi:hypothetical protein
MYRIVRMACGNENGVKYSNRQRLNENGGCNGGNGWLNDGVVMVVMKWQQAMYRRRLAMKVMAAINCSANVSNGVKAGGENGVIMNGRNEITQSA